MAAKQICICVKLPHIQWLLTKDIRMIVESHVFFFAVCLKRHLFKRNSGHKTHNPTSQESTQSRAGKFVVGYRSWMFRGPGDSEI